jgi:PAS domain S-box-containing protein
LNVNAWVKLKSHWTALESRFISLDLRRKDPLTFWQERILFIMCFLCSALGPLALIPSVLLAYKEGIVSVMILDCAAYLTMVLALLARRWSLKTRGYLACLALYSLGVGVSLLVGMNGGGYIWLFGASVMMSTIIGMGAALWSLALNALTLGSIAVLIYFGIPEWSLVLENALEKWLVLTVNFLLLNAFVTTTTAFMLDGLKKVLANEQSVSAHLRESQERYRIVADFNFDWEYWIGPDGALRYVSPSCHRITGYAMEEFVNDPGLLSAIVHPADHPQMAAHLAQDLTGGKARDSLDFRIMTQDGREIWINHNCQPVFADDGVFLGRRVGNRDITERKHIEANLQLHHERFLTVLDSIDAAIFVADLKTYEILFVNKRHIQNFGRDLTGTCCWQSLYGKSAPCEVCRNPALVGSDGAPTGVQVWHEQNPVTQKWYVNHERAVKWTDGRMVKIQIATDITELKRMETELRQAHKMEAIGTLAGGIAHDFNNILASIIGYTELGLDDAPPGTLLEDNLREVLTAGKRARDLVRQILAFARQSDEQVKPIQVRAIATEALRLIRSSLPTTIEIRQDLASAATIMGSPVQIHQILMNLCTNAAQAMETGGGLLTVTLADVRVPANGADPAANLAPGDYVRLGVADSGCGIPAEHLEQIFQPFFTTKEPGKGTGMGLAMVHGIVESYKGKITVKSELGKGSEFHLYFPAAKSEAVAELETGAVVKGHERILLVDDELAIVKMGSQMLEKLGYRVTSRTSSVEALSLFRSKPHDFDLVITDMTMPNMTGADLAMELMRVRRDIPVILCTGYSNKISDTLASQIGIRDFAYKPIVKKDLAEKIRNVLDESARPGPAPQSP